MGYLPDSCNLRGSSYILLHVPSLLQAQTLLVTEIILMGSKLSQPTKRFVLDECKNGHVPYRAPEEVDQGVEDPVVPVGHRPPLVKSNCWWQSSECRRRRLAAR